jgi:hypothetical protein
MHVNCVFHKQIIIFSKKNKNRNRAIYAGIQEKSTMFANKIDTKPADTPE